MCLRVSSWFHLILCKAFEINTARKANSTFRKAFVVLRKANSTSRKALVAPRKANNSVVIAFKTVLKASAVEEKMFSVEGKMISILGNRLFNNGKLFFLRS